MAILVDERTRVLVQGITGREGRARARLMREYGTKVVAGCTPGRGGESVDGTPVYDTVLEAVEASGGIDASAARRLSATSSSAASSRPGRIAPAVVPSPVAAWLPTRASSQTAGPASVAR